MFTIEIGGRPTAVTNASEEEARELLADQEFRSDLKSLTTGGTPLWNGKAPLTLRPATEDEVAEFEDANSDDEDEDEDDEQEGSVVVFLVPIVGEDDA